VAINNELQITVDEYSIAGRKEVNQDFHGVSIPKKPLLTSKGITIALADGISSSQVSQIASETAVRNFLEDYYHTSETWSVKKSGIQVVNAVNSWLYSQTQKTTLRLDKNKGYVCTLSAMVMKSNKAHIFHVGDSRIYRLRDKALEVLTEEHRVWLSEDKSYLGRGVGINQQVDIDYHSVDLKEGDVFLFMTDGIYEFVSPELMCQLVEKNKNLEGLARQLVDEAYQQGSDDNLTVQVARVDKIPSQATIELDEALIKLPFPPVLEARAEFDGYKIVRVLQSSSRSHVYLATDENDKQLVIKTPSIDLQNDPKYIERFLMEEWIARRIKNDHVLKPCLQTKQRNFLYLVTEFIAGQTLTQWMIDNPKPELEVVREIVEQIAKGLFAFHRQEMIHQDIRPNNIMIDKNGVVKIIDFGATKVAGIEEIMSLMERENILGTAQYTAPEYFLGEAGTAKSDMFSLGVITYQMLTGKLPYGTQVAKSRTKAAQARLYYQSVLDDEREIPAWMDYTLKKVLQPVPAKRYGEISEFLYDLRHPNKEFLNQTKPPLIERNPVGFWKGVSFVLVVIIILLLASN
jgi:serine/threonine protein phosphatase PrpC/predicted Ser/Thr protein kinase